MTRSYLFPMDVDPLTSVRLTPAQQGARYIPIEDLADEAPDPSEVLALKEEGLGVEKNDDYTVHPAINGNHTEHNGTNGHSVAQPVRLDTTDMDMEAFFEEIECASLRKLGPVRKLRGLPFESHGKRGRKPCRKDKFFGLIRY